MKRKPYVSKRPSGSKLHKKHMNLQFLPSKLGSGECDPLSTVATESESLRITVLTADTFGTAAVQLNGLPVEVHVTQTGAEKAKAVRAIGGEKVIAIGNGRNDLPMLEIAGLAIAVIGPEGAGAEMLRVADVVVNSVNDALDLVAHPLRLKATLRD